MTEVKRKAKTAKILVGAQRIKQLTYVFAVFEGEGSKSLVTAFGGNGKKKALDRLAIKIKSVIRLQGYEKARIATIGSPSERSRLEYDLESAAMRMDVKGLKIVERKQGSVATQVKLVSQWMDKFEALKDRMQGEPHRVGVAEADFSLVRSPQDGSVHVPAGEAVKKEQPEPIKITTAPMPEIVEISVPEKVPETVGKIEGEIPAENIELEKEVVESEQDTPDIEPTVDGFAKKEDVAEHSSEEQANDELPDLEEIKRKLAAAPTPQPVQPVDQSKPAHEKLIFVALIISALLVLMFG
jgi:hypothetical protein